MSVLAWFRGLFGKPSKKRQVVDNDIVYVGYITDKYPNAKVYKNGTKWQKITDFPPPGPLNEDQAKFMFARFATSTDKQVARKLNKLGYLTKRGNSWTENRVKYWKQTAEQLEQHREYCKKYKSQKKQTQTMIFRTAQMRPRQNGVN